MNEVYRDHLQQRLEQSRVPSHLHAGLIRYVGERRKPGGFLTAVLENSLSAAVGRTDPEGHAALPALVLFLVNFAPGTCWGSPEQVDAWLSDPAPAPEVFE